MKILLVLALAATSASLAACGSNADTRSKLSHEDTATTSTSSSASSGATRAPYDGPTIPEGTYRKEVTRTDLTEAGLSPAMFDYGAWPQGRNGIVTYKFDGDSWTQFGAFSESSLSPGSTGTLSYDDRGQLVLTEACCGETIIRWALAGRQLTMKATGPDQALADPMVKIMRDGTYARTE